MKENNKITIWVKWFFIAILTSLGIRDQFDQKSQDPCFFVDLSPATEKNPRATIWKGEFRLGEKFDFVFSFINFSLSTWLCLDEFQIIQDYMYSCSEKITFKRILIVEFFNLFFSWLKKVWQTVTHIASLAQLRLSNKS